MKKVKLIPAGVTYSELEKCINMELEKIYECHGENVEIKYITSQAGSIVCAVIEYDISRK